MKNFIATYYIDTANEMVIGKVQDTGGELAPKNLFANTVEDFMREATDITEWMRPPQMGVEPVDVTFQVVAKEEL